MDENVKTFSNDAFFRTKTHAIDIHRKSCSYLSISIFILKDISFLKKATKLTVNAPFWSAVSPNLFLRSFYEFQESTSRLHENLHLHLFTYILQNILQNIFAQKD